MATLTEAPDDPLRFVGRNLHREGRELLQSLLADGPVLATRVQAAAREADVPSNWIEIARRGIGVQVVRWRGELHYIHGTETLSMRDEFARPAGYWQDYLVIAVIQKFVREQGRLPTREEWQHGTRWHPSASQVERTFGSWEKAMLRADRDQVSREKVIGLMKDFHAEHGYAPNQREWTKLDYHPAQFVVKRVFGGWNAAVEAAGLEPRPRQGDKPRRRWTKAMVIEALQAFHRANGRPPQAREDQALSRAATHIFGSWNAALEAADLEVRYPRRAFSRDAELEAVRAYAQEHGHAPFRAEWPTQRRATRVVVEFGSWAGFLKAAGLAPRSQSTRSSHIKRAIEESLLTIHGQTAAEVRAALGLDATVQSVHEVLRALVRDGVLRRERLPRIGSTPSQYLYFPVEGRESQ